MPSISDACQQHARINPGVNTEQPTSTVPQISALLVRPWLARRLIPHLKREPKIPGGLGHCASLQISVESEAGLVIRREIGCGLVGRN